MKNFFVLSVAKVVQCTILLSPFRTNTFFIERHNRVSELLNERNL